MWIRAAAEQGYTGQESQWSHGEIPPVFDLPSHGEQFRLWFWDGAGEYVAMVWEPYEGAAEVGPWVELINSVRGAAGLVPRAFVAG